MEVIDVLLNPRVVSVADVVVNWAVVVDVVTDLMVMSALTFRIFGELGGIQSICIHWAVGNMLFSRAARSYPS